MTPQEFLDEFGTLAESADGVPKLRELILRLAYEGRLCPRDPDDEPGDTLLKRIQASHPEGRKFGGRWKKDEVRIDPMDCDGLFPTPTTWAWTILDFVCEQIGDVDHKMPPAVPDGVPFLSAKDLNDDGTLNFVNPKLISEEDFARLSRKIQLKRGDIIYSRIGTVGKARLVQTDRRFLISYSCCLVRPIDDLMDTLFVLRFMESRLALDQAHAGVKGIGVPDLRLAEIKRFRFPVPPLAEQHRIVSKVDELMGLCDRLEAVQGERRGVRVRLNRSSLDRLTSVSGAGARQRGSELSAAWQRVCDHFEVLYDTPETLPDLRQTILQLAVQGKLVPQDPNDEPIPAVLTRLEQNGGNPKVRRAVPEAVEPNEDVLSVPITGGWALESTARLLRLGAIVDVKDGNHGANHPTKAEFTDAGLPFITAAQVSDEGVIDYDGAYKVSGEPLKRLRVGFAKPDDVIYTHKGSVGRVAVCDRECILTPQTTYYRVNPEAIDNGYLRLFLLSPQFRLQVDAVKGQTTRDFVPIKAQYNFFVRLPPLSEQKRIVSKVTHLLSQVTRLESTLTRRESTRTQLLTAAIHQLLEG